MNYQLIWGVILLLAGGAVFYRIPAVIAKIKSIEQFSGNGIYFAYFCFCFIGTMLIGGGIKKIVNHIRKINKDASNQPNEGA